MSMRRIACLFGNEIYSTGLSRLNGVPNDVMKMSARLSCDGWKTPFISINYDSMAARQTCDGLSGIIDETHKQEGGAIELFLYYAGHGDTSGESSWKPAPRVVNDNFDLLDEAVKLATKPNVGCVYIVLDSCRSARISLDALNDKIKAHQGERVSPVDIIILSAGWNDAFEDKVIQAGKFTHALLEALSGEGELPTSWRELRAKIQTLSSELPCELIATSENLEDAKIPFQKSHEPWPSQPANQLEFILKYSERHIAFGALYGASRGTVGIREQVREVPDRLVATSAKFLDTRAPIDENNLIDWQTLDRLTLVPASPFHSVMGLTDQVSEALTLALATLLTDSAQDRQSGVEDDRTKHQWAQEVTSKYVVTFKELPRLGSTFRLLVARCAKHGDSKAFRTIALRFLVQSPMDEVQEGWPRKDQLERVVQELSGIDRTQGFFSNCVGRHTNILIGRKEFRPIGVAYTLKIAGDGVETLSQYLTDRFSSQRGDELKKSVMIIQNILREFFGRLARLDSAWEFEDENYLSEALQEELKSVAFRSYMDALTVMARSDFSGELKTNSLLAELRSIENFLRDICIESRTVGVENISGLTHGDMHQKNIIVPQGLDVTKVDDIVSLIDFGSAGGDAHALLDLASLEVSLVVFFLEDYAGLENITRVISRIEGEWTDRSDGALGEGETASIESLKAYTEEQFKIRDYNAYERVAHSVIGAMRKLMKAAIVRLYIAKYDRVPSSKELRGHLRQYYMLMFIRTVKLITVPSAPKAVVVGYACWLANQLRTDPDLMVEPVTQAAE